MNHLSYLFTYLRRLLILLLIYSTSRLFFYYKNIDNFSSVKIYEFIEGIRFDISALAYINIPLMLLLMVPLNIRLQKRYHQITNTLFYIINIPFIIFNNIDIEYFSFIQKRSTYDFIQILQLSGDTIKILPGYLKEYWEITILTVFQLWFLFKTRRIPRNKIKLDFYSITKSNIVLLFSIGIFILMARGGIQLKPIKVINAGELSNSQNIGLILNTPFCLLHSLKENDLKTYNYYDKNMLDTIYSPIHSNNQNIFKKNNVIILIMESYSKEFIGFYNKEKETCTPFLDSIMNNSLVFINAYANGLKSIEALPAITASVPALMDNPFITSKYAQNKFTSLAHILKKEGYSTTFFHGGRRGTMGFYSFSKKAGFDNYFGLEEYNNIIDFDGSWGIFDEPFLRYFAKNLKNETKPFFATFFSLSSHPPYTLPNYYKSESSNTGIQKTIKYSDYSLKKFFDKIKKEHWFKNTIFIITADHTSGERYNNQYNNQIGKYAIPMLIYKGDNSFKGINSNIVQQIDIMPTILDVIGYNKKFFSFGKSMIKNKEWAISYLQKTYHLITPNRITINKNNNYHTFKDWELKEEIKLNTKDVTLLNAIKQNYNNRMLENNLSYEN